MISHAVNTQLMVVMPVYNEQASVRKVVLEWFQELQNWTEDFIFFVINDGSKDETLAILHRIQNQLGQRLEICNQENIGHGQTCLLGYREACRRGIPYVFQIDSDGQCDPQYFFRFWRMRDEFDVIYGKRAKRADGWRRIIASHVLRLTLLLTTHVNCVDANSPYRLMRTSGLEPFVNRIPSDFFLANVALAVLLRQDPAWRHGKVAIRFRERYGGEPSVRLGKFGEKARELISQLLTLRQESR